MPLRLPTITNVRIHETTDGVLLCEAVVNVARPAEYVRLDFVVTARATGVCGGAVAEVLRAPARARFLPGRLIEFE